MNFEKFQKMSHGEAAEFLQLFREQGAVSLARLLSGTAKSHFGFEIQTLTEFLCNVVALLHAVPRAPDPSVPEYIRATADYANGLYDFSPESVDDICAAGVYMGDCFIRAHPSLGWATGNADTALRNMPVVSGFKYGMELAPLLVLDNVFRRVKEGGDPKHEIGRMVNYWLSCV